MMALLLLVITAYQLNAQSPYGLTVAGKDVTASNASNILKGIPNASGVMSYDKETKTLTLENVVLECKSYVNAIQTEESMDDLTIPTPRRKCHHTSFGTYRVQWS